MADELKSFEQTHWLRVYVAAEIFSEDVTGAHYTQRGFVERWAGLKPWQQKEYLLRADNRILEFKAAVEAAQ